MKIPTDSPSLAVMHIMNTELDTNIQRLQDAQAIPATLRAKRMDLLRQLSELKQSTMVLTRDALEVEKARLLFEITEAVDDKGKAKYSNETARNAALTLKMAEDEPYQEAIAAHRAIEKEVERLNLAVQEVDEEIKTAAELNYAARLFVQGSLTALQAIVAFDGPKLPTEIRHVFPESLPAIPIKGVA